MGGLDVMGCHVMLYNLNVWIDRKLSGGRDRLIALSKSLERVRFWSEQDTPSGSTAVMLCNVRSCKVM